ncbi:MAG TPA: DUF2802 domain-containing protein [Povalibacter sp.]|nr:DUF2802 domain-containing protein [Povalibacter sp.]
MFEILPNPSLETLLLAARAILLVGALWIFALAFIRWRRADERGNEKLHAQLERAFVELRSLHETVSVMSARLDALSRESAIDSHLAPSGTQRGYDVATRLARNGANAEDLINNCGITRHEAELLVRLHNTRVREPAPAPARPQPAAEARRQQQRAQQPQAQQPQAQQPQAAQPPATARKRGSLLSVVG